jgi:hypothetical protein
MRNDVHRLLRYLAEKRDMEYGKLVQKLLGIAFCEAGAKSITDRGTQGIDLEVELADGRCCAFEVKTAQDNNVTFGKKDIDGLYARHEKDGYAPYFALLGSRLLDEWIFSRYVRGEIRDKRAYELTFLRAYRDAKLEKLVRMTFPEAVIKHCDAAVNGGQAALDEQLRKYDCYRIA